MNEYKLTPEFIALTESNEFRVLQTYSNFLERLKEEVETDGNSRFREILARARHQLMTSLAFLNSLRETAPLYAELVSVLTIGEEEDAVLPTQAQVIVSIDHQLATLKPLQEELYERIRASRKISQKE